jgi:hypothetical protein
MKNQNQSMASAIANQLAKINLIVTYPYPDDALDAMAHNIIRLIPDISLKEVEKTMDDFLKGKEFIHSKGFQNIYLGLMAVRKPKTREL